MNTHPIFKTVPKVLFLTLLLNTQLTVAQVDTLKIKPSGEEGFYVMEFDTIRLDEVHLLTKLNFQSRDDRNYYYWLRKKVHKAYPYAVLAQQRLAVINKNLENMNSRSKKKTYLRRLQKYFEEEFTDQLKKLTVTEGRILIKLVHRQTGQTVYELSKEYKSGWSAFWNQKTAKLFKQDLKDQYEPATDNEDFLTELILERAFEERTLQSQPTVLHFDFEKIKKSKGKYIPIERRI